MLQEYFLLFTLFFLSCGSGTIGKEDLETKQILVPLADPFILLYNDLYYIMRMEQGLKRGSDI